MSIVKVADGAFFVPSYSEQTILRAYTVDMTVQDYGVIAVDERRAADERPVQLQGLERHLTQPT